MTDAIGLRVVCLFIDDVYENVALLKSLPGCTVVREKDYIRDAKPNGYRSYHMILDVASDEADVDGAVPGHYYVEIQLRTIAMDTWAALEHQMRYKNRSERANDSLIISELKRCADELASTDLSMQTIRDMILEYKTEE
jgi:GTP pyrophosphokinase